MPNITEILSGNSRSKKTIFWAVVIIVCVIIMLMVADFLFYSSKKFNRLSNWVNPDRYQAIFLSNGQVYFGRVADVTPETLLIEDIYYLKTVQTLQASEGGAGETPEKANPESIDTENFSLVKLGNEIHGPEDNMSVNLEHVLFVENLKPESKVVEAIREYKDRK
ncbi:MAG: hypothetical protein WC745_01745 [Patescibacteria group bacterium]|jgi:hypothetical protein